METASLQNKITYMQRPHRKFALYLRYDANNKKTVILSTISQKDKKKVFFFSRTELQKSTGTKMLRVNDTGCIYIEHTYILRHSQQ